jgi:uncharacterized membrane protein YhaH (DUF805 family)
MLPRRRLQLGRMLAQTPLAPEPGCENRERFMNFAEVLTQQFLFTWQGRINRQRYWTFVLVYIGLAILAGIIDRVIGSEMGIVGLLLGLAMIYPGICVGIKRWHDRDKSGWWTLIILIPIIGAIWSLVELGFLKGTEGENRFGSDPLSAS